jgi:acyl transferase domain-containing protein
MRAALDKIALKAPRVPVFMGTSGKAETDPARIRELLVEQSTACERHLDAVRAAYAAGCRNFVEVSFKPQPVTWLGEQLVDADGSRLPGVSSLAATSAELQP